MKAHKNRGNTTANNWRQTAIFGSVLLMLISLLISRAALSASMMMFIGVSITHKDWMLHLKNFITTPFLVFFSLLFFIPLVSGLWSSDLNKWSDVVRIKLPLIFFPLAFAGNWMLLPKQWLMTAYLFLFIVFAGCVWGLTDYAINMETIHQGYLRAKTILTPLEDDHVRFSWMVSIAVILCFLLMQIIQRRQVKVLLLLLATFFAVYLHILSARTGLLSFYIFLLLYAVWASYRIKNRKWSLGLLLLLVILPLAAYFILPTFKARIRYNLYDLSFVQKEQYLPGSSDGARVMSLNAGWHVLKENPFGAGAGDIMKEADKWYAGNVPEVLPGDKFYPSSEWLMYGGFAGWPGLVLFSFIMVFPFYITVKRFKIFWVCFHATAAFSFVFDMGLEVQYGIFIYAFVTFWWWKWFDPNGELKQLT